jgi:hypothetical protein
MDQNILKAAEICGINPKIIRKALPKILTMWIDPGQVTYILVQNGRRHILYRRNYYHPPTPIWTDQYNDQRLYYEKRNTQYSNPVQPEK